jgi:hypothetical protein
MHDIGGDQYGIDGEVSNSSRSVSRNFLKFQVLICHSLPPRANKKKLDYRGYRMEREFKLTHQS